MSILTEADALINGSRAAAYGKAADNFQHIADLWNVWLDARYKGETFRLDTRDIGMMMTLLKIAREANKVGRDNILDAAGYLGCIEQIDVELERREIIAKNADTESILAILNDTPLPDSANAPREDTPTMRPRPMCDDSAPPESYDSYRTKCDCAGCSRGRTIFQK